MAADCAPQTNECVANTCASSCCGTTNLDATHTLSTGQAAGDCQKIVCDGNGGTKSIDDPTDLPSPTETCKTMPACMGTPLAPSFMPAATGTDCSGEQAPGSKKHVCGDIAGTAAGSCVECNAASDCAASTNECVMATCTNNVCGTTNLDSTHVLAAQTGGDCQKLVCNGAGGSMSLDDPTDLPSTTEICKTNPTCAGTPLIPTFTPAATDTDCSAEQAPGSKSHLCGATTGVAAGTCVECNADADCTSDAGTCTNNVCN